jgi:hypothetical protein
VRACARARIDQAIISLGSYVRILYLEPSKPTFSWSIADDRMIDSHVRKIITTAFRTVRTTIYGI